jgi:O-antigen ligase
MIEPLLEEKGLFFLWYFLLIAILWPQAFSETHSFLLFLGLKFLWKINLFIYIFSFIVAYALLIFRLSSLNRAGFTFIIFLLAFFLLIFISFLWSSYPSFSLSTSIFFLFQIFPVVIFTIFSKKPKKLLMNTSYFLSFLGFTASLFQLVFLRWKKIINFSNLKNVGGVYNISSSLSNLMFQNPNCLAFWLFITISFTILALIETKKWKVFLFFLVPQSIVFFFTFSRATLIALFGFLFCFFFTLRKKEKLLIFVFLIFIISFLIGFIGWKNKGIIPTRGISDRVEIWKLGFQFWKENLILGKGFATSPWLLWERVQNVHFHNNFLQIGVELGILGFLLYLFSWIYPIKIGLRKFNENKMSENIIPLAFILSFEFGTFLNSFFESLITYPPFPFFASIWFFLTTFLVNPYFP